MSDCPCDGKCPTCECQQQEKDERPEAIVIPFRPRVKQSQATPALIVEKTKEE